MPYVGAQRAKCYAMRAFFAKRGEKSPWDCNGRGEGKRRRRPKGTLTPAMRLYRKLSAGGRIARASDVPLKRTGRAPGSGTVRTGPRGGHYVIIDGEKIHIGGAARRKRKSRSTRRSSR